MKRLSPRHLVAIASTLVGMGALPAQHAPGGYLERLHAAHGSGAASDAKGGARPSLRSLRLRSGQALQSHSGQALQSHSGQALQSHSGQAGRQLSWDVALIQHCGYWSHYDYVCERSVWPVSGAATASEFAAFGAERGALREQPDVGDIFLQWAPRRSSFVHAGIIEAVVARCRRDSVWPYYDVITIEGDTNTHGQLRCGVAERMIRQLSAAKGDRFLRWTALESSEQRRRPVDEGIARSAS